MTNDARTYPTPTDDLYLHVNGEWIDSHTIPADRAIDGAFHSLRDDSEKDVRTIIESAPEDSRIGTLYSSFMNTEAIEKAGVSALSTDFAEIAVDTKEDLALALARLDRVGILAAAGYWIEKDSKSNESMLYLLQSGLGLPDEAYYREPSHAETLQKYQEHVGRMLTLLVTAAENEHVDDVVKQLLTATNANAEDAAARIIELEKKIAAGHWDVVAKRDALKTYNLTATADLPTTFPWAQWLRATGVEVEKCVVMMPSYFEDFGTVWTEADLSDLQLWALWRILHGRAPYLPEVFSKENFDFYGRSLSGAEEQRDRWKRGVGFVEGAVGFEVGKEYVAQHFPPEYKAQMLELVDYLLQAYRERITNLPWMTPATRERALEKLSLFKAKIGYPNSWRDYSALQVGRDLQATDLMGNVRATSRFSHEYELAKLGKPADRDEWFATPQTVNAFYNPVVNDITFPAAILKPPFFDPEADMATNFGAIGAVIGHEIGHGFDDQGSQYDGHGNLNQWWTDEDRKAFEKLTAQLVHQFDGLVPTGLKKLGEEDAGVNGKFTLGENIGDLGGLGIAVVAYRRWIADHGAEAGIEDTPESYRGMFLSWALVWRTAIRPELSRQYLAIDPHSPAEFRCNVIATDIDEFHEAFGTQPGDGMWREPSERVHIW
ncbi:M13 family metallopeptidase [Corynebacterium sp. H113]|uniref:M13 family metallopeptidase n=1 Tax=Corynebacterium sp. H113 TaxID=3133419 RepID=UPI0030B2DBD2